MPVHCKFGNACVVGLQWGDEGKGQVVDLLANEFDVVVRYNGGANAGHSVEIGDQKFALHLIPSGILSTEKLNVIGNGVVVDPATLLKEITGLRERGVKIGENLRVSNRAHVVFPYHKLQDNLYDLALTQSAGSEKKIGTTGRGIGPAYADKALRSTAVRMGELVHTNHIREKLKHIVKVKNTILSALAKECGQSYEPYDTSLVCHEYLDYARQLEPFVCDTTQLLQQASSAGKRLLFEGANAALLDIDHGTYPFVTSSNCSSLGVYSGTGLPGGTLNEVIGVVKAYASRVGGGPHPTELTDQIGEQIRKTGREYGTTTGRPRRCGWLDLVAVRYTAALNGTTRICLTGISVLSGLKKLRVCVGYQYGTRKLDEFPPDGELLAELEPIYEELEGFAEPVDECTCYSELPDAAKSYVDRLEQFIGIPVTMVCVGRRRDQILQRSHTR